MSDLKLVIHDQAPIRYTSDCERIVGVLEAAHPGLLVTLQQARDLWQIVSDASCAGWLSLPEENQQLLFQLMCHYHVEASDEQAI